MQGKMIATKTAMQNRTIVCKELVPETKDLFFLQPKEQ